MHSLPKKNVDENVIEIYHTKNNGECINYYSCRNAFNLIHTWNGLETKMWINEINTYSTDVYDRHRREPQSHALPRIFILFVLTSTVQLCLGHTQSCVLRSNNFSLAFYSFLSSKHYLCIQFCCGWLMKWNKKT